MGTVLSFVAVWVPTAEGGAILEYSVTGFEGISLEAVDVGKKSRRLSTPTGESRTGL
jgi:hypothetical protein